MEAITTICMSYMEGKLDKMVVLTGNFHKRI
jgi:hypothetical protein